jgi:hypothetical protein
VVHEPVDDRGGGDVVAEDFAPRAEGLVGGDDQVARSWRRETSMNMRFAAWGSKGIHEVRGLGVKGDVSDFVADQ